jgi:hypothetical protein
MHQTVSSVSRLRNQSLGSVTALAAIIFAAAQPAHAQAPRWAMDAAGCVPTGTTIHDRTHFITAGHVKFNAGATGQITLICPVSVGVGTVNHMRLAYLDSTGTGTNSGVRAQLRRVRKTTGSAATVPGFDFDSNASFPSMTVWAYRGTGTSHTLDDFNYYYFIQITLARNNTTDIASIAGVELSKVIE